MRLQARSFGVMAVTAVAILTGASDPDRREAGLAAAACANELQQSYQIEASPNRVIPELAVTPIWTTAWQSLGASNFGYAGDPFVQDDQVYTVGPDNVLHVLSVSTGRERWSLGGSEETRLFSFRQISSGLIALIGDSRKATLVRFDAAGHRLWQRLFQGRSQPMPRSLSTDGDQIFLAFSAVEGSSPLNSEPARLQAIGLDDGKDRWVRPLALQPDGLTSEANGTVSTPVGSSVVVHEIFIDPTPKLGKPPKTIVLGLDRATGERRWVLDPYAGLEEPIGVVDGALLSAQSNPKALLRRDPTSGAEVGRYQDCLLNAGLTGYAIDGTHVFWMPGTEVLAADLRSQKRLWTLQLGRGGAPQSVAPAVSDGHLYLGGSDGGFIYSVDPTTGHVWGRFQAVENRRYGPPPIRTGDLLLVQYEQLTAYRLPQT